MKKVLTITTDFGDQFATSQLRAVIASLGYDGHIIENHSVTPFSISEGAFQIKQIKKFSPTDSVHVGVIDPGVGSERWGIAVETNKSWYVGPNNGLLYPAVIDEGIKSVWRLKESAFGTDVAITFHGRDVFIKAAVYLAQGKKPEEFAALQVKKSDMQKLEFTDGEIVHIDKYGNYKIYWPHNLITGRVIQVKTDKKQIYQIPVVNTFNDVPESAPLAYLGSHNTLEIALNLSNAKKHFNFSLGEKLKIQQI